MTMTLLMLLILFSTQIPSNNSLVRTLIGPVQVSLLVQVMAIVVAAAVVRMGHNCMVVQQDNIRTLPIDVVVVVR